VKTPTSVLVILDKPKHEQSALVEAKSLLVKHPEVHLKLVSFVWHAMAAQKNVYDASQRRAIKREIIRVREAWLRDLIRDEGLSAASINIEVVWTDDISGWVLEASSGSDLVIKSVHKSKTLLHTPLDWELIRSCPRPLLMVGGFKGKRRKKKARAESDVIATIDLRSEDRKHRILNLRVLDAAARFAELRGGRLHCVAVVEYSEVLSDLEVIDPRKIRKEAVAASGEFLEALIEPYDIARTRVHRPAGKVGHMVAQTVRKTGAGLVVVGSAARRGLGARLLGNSAEKILERSPCDVLVIHP
jgi:universal stress protein E